MIDYGDSLKQAHIDELIDRMLYPNSDIYKKFDIPRVDWKYNMKDFREYCFHFIPGERKLRICSQLIQDMDVTEEKVFDTYGYDYEHKYKSELHGIILVLIFDSWNSKFFFVVLHSEGELIPSSKKGKYQFKVDKNG